MLDVLTRHVLPWADQLGSVGSMVFRREKMKEKDEEDGWRIWGPKSRRIRQEVRKWMTVGGMENGWSWDGEVVNESLLKRWWGDCVTLKLTLRNGEACQMQPAAPSHVVFLFWLIPHKQEMIVGAPTRGGSRLCLPREKFQSTPAPIQMPAPFDSNA